MGRTIVPIHGAHHQRIIHTSSLPFVCAMWIVDCVDLTLVGEGSASGLMPTLDGKAIEVRCRWFNEEKQAEREAEWMLTDERTIRV